MATTDKLAKTIILAIVTASGTCSVLASNAKHLNEITKLEEIGQNLFNVSCKNGSYFEHVTAQDIATKHICPTSANTKSAKLSSMLATGTCVIRYLYHSDTLTNSSVMFNRFFVDKTKTYDACFLFAWYTVPENHRIVVKSLELQAEVTGSFKDKAKVTINSDRAMNPDPVTQVIKDDHKGIVTFNFEKPLISRCSENGSTQTRFLTSILLDGTQMDKTTNPKIAIESIKLTEAYLEKC